MFNSYYCSCFSNSIKAASQKQTGPQSIPILTTNLYFGTKSCTGKLTCYATEKFEGERHRFRRRLSYMKIHEHIICHWVTQKVYISDICICRSCYVKWLRRMGMVKEEGYLKENILHVYDH